MSEETIVSAIAGEKIYPGDCVEVIDDKAKRTICQEASHIAIDGAEKGKKVELVVLERANDFYFDIEEGK